MNNLWQISWRPQDLLGNAHEQAHQRCHEQGVYPCHLYAISQAALQLAMHASLATACPPKYVQVTDSADLITPPNFKKIGNKEVELLRWLKRGVMPCSGMTCKGHQVRCATAATASTFDAALFTAEVNVTHMCRQCRSSPSVVQESSKGALLGLPAVAGNQVSGRQRAFYLILYGEERDRKASPPTRA